MENSMISFENVTFSYDKKINVLNNISFKIEDGERVGIIGANAAGKSTLLKALLNLISFEGNIIVDGLRVCAENNAYIRKKIGLCLQDSNHQMFMPSVMEDMIFGPVNYGVSKEEAIEHAKATLKKLDYEYLEDKKNYQLSGGEKRMAAIATILNMEPEVILMDEPSLALDPQNRRTLINLLNSIEGTKIIVSHDLDMILDTCDRVILLSEGKVVADGDVNSILWNEELLENNHLELPLCLQKR